MYQIREYDETVTWIHNKFSSFHTMKLERELTAAGKKFNTFGVSRHIDGGVIYTKLN